MMALSASRRCLARACGVRVGAVPQLARATYCTEGESIFSPTPDHQALREATRKWAEAEVLPQATEFNRSETFNVDLFRRAGEELGILGITVDPEHGGAGSFVPAQGPCAPHVHAACLLIVLCWLVLWERGCGCGNAVVGMRLWWCRP